MAYVGLGEYRLGEAELDRSIEFSPDDGLAHYQLARVRMLMGNWKIAKRELVAAENLGVDVAVQFNREDGSIDAFQERFSLTMPVDIIQLVS